MSLGSIMQVARVNAPVTVTSVSASASAGAAAVNVASTMTKIGTTVGDGKVPSGPITFVSSQDGRLIFGTSTLATATATAGIPIAAKVPYTLFIKASHSYVSWYNAGSATGYLTFFDPEA